MEEFSGIAIDGSGRIYGVKTSDGGLYTIDKKTGEQKLVGLTGVKPHALQSMAFDRKTGILYWAVRAPESVSYLATVNVNTGGVRRLAYLPTMSSFRASMCPTWPMRALRLRQRM